MMIECPNCGRTGHLPNRLGAGTNTLRCRRCQSRFVVNAPLRDGAPTLSAPVEPTPSLRGPGPMAPLPAVEFFAGFDEDDPSWNEPGPGDSHYELTVPFEDLSDQSGDDWPLVSPS